MTVNLILFIFRDILHYGLKKYGTLPRYELTSVLASAATADIDFDGCDEILIGNSNQVLLVVYLIWDSE